MSNTLQPARKIRWASVGMIVRERARTRYDELMSNRLTMHAFLALGMFSAAFALTAVVQHWTTINSLWLAASQQKYATMTGTSGPVTYLVTHSDYQSLEQAVLAMDEVIGIEVYDFPDIAAIAFRANSDQAITQVAALSVTKTMRQRVVPMLCH